MKVLAALATFLALAFRQTAAQEDSTLPDFFAGKQHLGIHLNEHAHDLNTVINESDKLVLVYVYHSGSHIEDGQDWSILNHLFMKVLDELKGGYVETYVLDCMVEHPVIDPDINLDYLCNKRDSKQPVFTLYKPAEIKVNPYTGKEMPVSVIPYASNQVSDPDVKKWITDNVPDFTQRLSTKEDAEQFASEEGIRKVYLLSAKQKVPPIYKALAANFRNRVRFGFTNPEASVSGELASQFDVSKWPTLLIAGETGENHIVFDGKMKLNELIDFVTPYALPADQAKEERVISSKQQTTVNQQSDSSGYQLLTSFSDIESKILDNWQGSLLYVGQKDDLSYLSILEDFAKEYGMFLNVNLFVIEDAAASSADLKREFKSTKLPLFRFYPNNKTGQDKRNNSFEIILPKTDDLAEVKEAILEEIVSNFESDVKDVSEKVYYSLAAQNSRDEKITIAYLYDGTGVDFTFKAISADPWMKDDFIFMAIDGPSESMTQNSPLPAITGML